MVPVTFAVAGLSAGQYEGFVKVSGSTSGVDVRAPYWFAVPSDTPGAVTALWAVGISDDETPRAGARVNNAFYFRVTDASGVVLPNAQPVVSVVSGGGAVISTVSQDRQYPGVFSSSIQLGPRKGDNVFSIAVGDLQPIQINITGN